MSIDLSKPYNRKDAMNFLAQDFLPNDFLPIEEDIDIPFSSSRMIKKATLLGTCDSLDLRIYEFEHESEHDPRVTITKEAFRFLASQGQQKSLAFFKSKSDNYRFSLITMDLKTDGKKIEKIMSNPRRYSYYLGTNAKVNTPTKFLLINGRVTDFINLKDRFSVEVVNKEFFDIIAEQFMQLVGGKRGTKDYQNGCLTLPGINDHQLKQEFGVRLLGRIIFCWFLKKKTSIQGKSLIENGILDSESVHRNYYHAILEVLFFEILNKPIGERNSLFRNVIYDSIPFLNGGLFEPHDDDYYIFDQKCNIVEYANIGFSKYNSQLLIKDNWFKELFDHLETYNFTIDENTSSDIDLSVDPEMLGRIFENLLAEINPETGESLRNSTGSFYTRREIVDYMVNQSLIYFLNIKTGITEEKLMMQIDNYDETELNEEEKEKIVHSLSEIKILDPACGSGAFPMGILQKIVSILQEIDPLSKIWINQQLKGTSIPYLKEAIQQEIRPESVNYIHKLGLIQHCLFGVDIQEIAVEISKLRFFLSLIVDATVDDKKPNRDLKPLPNLEFKFVCANSLIDLPKERQTQLIASDIGYSSEQIILELKDLRNRYFEGSGKDKEQIKQDFKEKQNKLFKYVYLQDTKNIESKMLSEWDPFSTKTSGWFNPEWMFGIEDGFDIVIANPPYVQLQKFKGNPLQQAYKNQKYEVYDSSGDIYCLFFEKGMSLLNQNGILCYISSNKWMRAGYGEKLRAFFSRYTPRLLIDLGSKVFISATVDTNILILQKLLQKQKSQTFQAVTIKIENDDLTDLYKIIKNNAVNLTTPGREIWFIGSNIEMQLKEKIERLGKPLNEWNVKIYRGILTGLNEAFIIDTPTKERICKEDPKSTEILKPILRGKDIKRYSYEWAGLWLIQSGYSINIPREFPSIYKYLLNFEEKAKNRDDQGQNWWNLRACSYYSEFDKEKIIWQELTQGSRFALDKKGEFYVSNTGYILTCNSLKYVLGLLNSRLNEFIFKKWIGTIIGENGIRWLNQHVINIPVPIINHINAQIKMDIEILTDQIFERMENSQNISIYEKKIDNLVYQLFELNQEEINLVENSA